MITKFKVGQELRKVWDNSIVTIKEVNEDNIVLDGDFESNHVVIKEKVKNYYTEVL